MGTENQEPVVKGKKVKGKQVVKAQRKLRVTRNYCVLECGKSDAYMLVGTDVKTLKGAEGWVLANGKPGVKYQPAMLVGDSLSVKVEEVRKSALVR